MPRRPVLIALVLGALVAVAAVVVSFLAFGTDPEEALTRATTSVADGPPTTARPIGDESEPDGPVSDPAFDSVPATGLPPALDPPGESEAGVAPVPQRWPGIADATIDAADVAVERRVTGGGRALVLVRCAPEPTLVVAVVGVDAETDVVVLADPPIDPLPRLVTDRDGNGLTVTPTALVDEDYALTFPALAGLSVSVTGCPIPG